MANDPAIPPYFKREKQLGHATDQDIAKYVADFISKSKAAGDSAKQGSLWQQVKAEGFPATRVRLFAELRVRVESARGRPKKL